jgi:16S rRNA (guanine(527)-N(7))-methyltransferase RsmG
VKQSADLIAQIAPDARARLDRFAELLLRWNSRINLISRADEAELWPRHILDSAQLVNLLPRSPGTLVDLGSGAGFPGLVLAVMTRWDVHLVESDQRKAAFLREAARTAGARVVVHAIRAEKLTIAPAQVVAARALAPIASLLPLAAPLLGADGICLFPKGRSADAELTDAAARWHMRVERFPSHTESGATLLRISEIRRAG